MKHNTYLGALFAVLSALAYAFQVLVIKMTTAHLPVPILVFVLSVVCLILVFPMVCYRHGKKPLNPLTFTTIKTQHFLRAIFSLGISYFLFTALKKISYFDSVLLFNTFPIFIPFLALLILRTKINHVLWPFVFIGFFGVALTLKVDDSMFSSGAFFAMGSAISAGLSIVMMRKISAQDDSLKSLYYYFLLSTIISGVASIPFWNQAEQMNILAVISAGILFFLVQYFLTLAATYATPQIVSTLYYSNIIFSLILAYILFNEQMTAAMITGMIGIIAGGLGVIYFGKPKIKT